MEYCVFVEHNQKERESYIFYLQYTGNEKELELLYKLVTKADNGNLVGDVAYFEMADPSLRISQAAVDEHMKLKSFGSYCKTFQVANGTFQFPWDDTEVDELDEYDTARALDRRFFHGCIRSCFKQ